MSSEEVLPDYFDVIVLGSGLPESIIAAACSRTGLSVLHLDRNDFYGGKWASFNLRSVYDWEKKIRSREGGKRPAVEESLLKDGEEIVMLRDEAEASDVHIQWDIDSDTVQRDESSEASRNLKKDIEEHWRSFSIDLLPKLLLSKGEMVQLLCDSGVSRYCEFKCVNRLLCCSDENESLAKGFVNEFDVVPCTKADIFQSNSLSRLDKRRIMRFFSSLKERKDSFEENDELRDEGKIPFDEFLEKQGITGKVKKYIADTVGVLQTDTTTKGGLEAVYQFLESLGRFGNSPFLWTLYGSGELSQCYCRLCAVFGGTYCLNRSIDGLVLAANRVVAVITNGQRIGCGKLVTDSSYLPEQYVQHETTKRVLRAALISDRSLLHDPEKDHLSVLNLRRLNPELSARLIEVGYEGCVAPRKYFLSHITGIGKENVSEMQDLISLLYKRNSSIAEEASDNRPRLLWSIIWAMAIPEVWVSRLPENLRVVPSIDSSLDYTSVVQKTRQLFLELWADRDFLPPSLKKDEEEEDTEAVPATEFATELEELPASGKGNADS